MAQMASTHTGHSGSNTMRESLADAGPVQALRLALTKAFPDRQDIATFPFDGSLSQAWQSFGRLLALAPGAMAKALSPVYETPPAGSLYDAQPGALAPGCALPPHAFVHQARPHRHQYPGATAA